MAHWLDGVARVLMSPELDLKNLANLSGCNPTNLYEDCDLSECDLRGQDLRGLSFAGAQLEGAIIDSRTKIDAGYDPRLRLPQHFAMRVNKKTLRLINSQAYKTGYTYAVWFVKWCFELSYNLRNDKEMLEIIEDVEQLGLDDFYTSYDYHDSMRRHIKLPIHIGNFAKELPRNIPYQNRPSFILFTLLLYRNKKHTGPANVLQIIESLVEQDEEIRKKMGYMSGF